MSELHNVLERARQLGFFGPSEIEGQINHALAFLPLLTSIKSETDSVSIVDLGAGGGLPSLPLLEAEPSLSISMLDTSERRCSFLTWAISELGFAQRAQVLHRRAEEFASEIENRETFDAVIARGFGPPAATIESGAPLVRLGGLVVISEPPKQRNWPAEALATVGLELAETGQVVAFSKVAESPAEFPRSWKHIKAKPLFRI